MKVGCPEAVSDSNIKYIHTNVKECQNSTHSNLSAETKPSQTKEKQLMKEKIHVNPKNCHVDKRRLSCNSVEKKPIFVFFFFWTKIFSIMCPSWLRASQNPYPFPPIVFPPFSLYYFYKAISREGDDPLSAESGKARGTNNAASDSAVVDGERLNRDSSTDSGGNVRRARGNDGGNDGSGSDFRAGVARATALRASARAARAGVGAGVGAGAIVNGLVSEGRSRARVTRARGNGDIDGRGGDSDSLLGDGDGDGGGALARASAVSRGAVGRRGVATSASTRAATGGLNRSDCDVLRVSSGSSGGGGRFRAVLTVAESAGDGDGLLGGGLDGGGDNRGISSLANGVGQGLVGDDVGDGDGHVSRRSDGGSCGLDG